MESTKQSFGGGVLRAKDAAKFLGIGLSTFWRWSQQGKLPHGICLSARCTVWRREDLEAFIERQTAQEGGVQ